MVLRPEVVGEVLHLLDSSGLEPVSVSNVEGVGRQRGHTEIFRGREYKIETRPKVRIEVLVKTGGMRESLLEKIREVVYTGHVGDGKIFVFRVEAPSPAGYSARAVSSLE